MKKIFLLLALTLSLFVNAQEQTTDKKYTFYSATGISVTNTDDFQNDSYVSTEIGLMRENIAFGTIIGRNNLAGLGKETFKNYWLEEKVTVYKNFGSVDGFLLLGVGSYIDHGNLFIEYGFGVSKTLGDYGVFVQASNWDSKDYVSAGVSFNLN